MTCSRPRWRLLVTLVTIAFIASACSTTESVTIDASAFARATAAVTTPTAEPAPEPTPVPAPEPSPAADRTPEPEPEPAPTVEAAEEEDPEPQAEEATEAVTETAGDPQCSFLQINQFDNVEVEIDVVVDLKKQDDATLEYSLIDASDTRFHTGTIFLEDIAPGEQLRLAVDTLQDLPAGTDASTLSCEFLELDSFGFGDDPFRPTGSDTCRFAEFDTFDDVQIEVEFTNPTGEQTDLALDYALRGPGGVRYDDGVAFISEVGVGETIRHSIDTFAEFPEWVPQSEFSCDILAIEQFG